MNRKVFVSLMLSSLVLVACGSNPTKKSLSKPDWIVNEPVKAGHVYGVGSAPIYSNPAEALQRAGDAARVAMIQKLKVTVTGNLSSDVQEIRQTGKETQVIKNVRNAISSRIPKAELDNLEVVESYADEVNRTVYRLVHLDRVKATSSLRQRIAGLDMQATTLAEQTPTNTATLKQLQGLLPALELIAKREQLAEQAQLVDVNSRRPAKDESLKAVETRIKSLLDQLTVSLQPSGNDAKNMRSHITRYLTDLGLRISQGEADLQVSYSAQMNSVEKGGRYIAFANGKINIQDSAGRTLSEFRNEAKGVSGASNDQAELKAIQNLADNLGKELTSSLFSKID